MSGSIHFGGKTNGRNSVFCLGRIPCHRCQKLTTWITLGVPMTEENLRMFPSMVRMMCRSKINKIQQRSLRFASVLWYIQDLKTAKMTH